MSVDAENRVPLRAAAAFPHDTIIWLALGMVYALTHPFVGIDGDARIYMGRALADVDPTGVGRDLMFVLDGQSGFTIFRPAAKMLTEAFGLAGTVLTMTLVNIGAWFVAIAVLTRTIVPGRAALLALAVAIVLPRLYTPWNLLSVGESIPEPRPLAEAAVLLAMAALVRGRLRIAVTSLVIAALIHPIMAAPGVGVLLLMKAQRDKRWILLPVALGVLVVGAGLLGAPYASHLMLKMDPAWRSVLADRNPYLFLTHWPLESPSPYVVRAITLGFACLWIGQAGRSLLSAAAIVAIVGVAASIILGDLLSTRLGLQAQLWRALWLPTALSNVAAGICLLRLPQSGVAGRLALALLALAWITSDTLMGPATALLAFGVFVGVPRLSFPISRATEVAIIGCCALLAAATIVTSVKAVAAIAHALPADQPGAWSAFCALHLPLPMVAGLAALWWRNPDGAAMRVGAWIVAASALALLVTQWDARSTAQADVDAARAKPDLVSLIGQRPGEILWTEGDEAWAWLHRANWNGQVQGAAGVFSRDLALTWRARAEAVVQAGLAPESLLHPLLASAPSQLPSPDAMKISTFCSDPDRPTWIVTPFPADRPLPTAWNALSWSPPSPRGRQVVESDSFHWQTFDRYAVIPCAAPRTKEP